jgi:hypothetical protein
MPVAGGPKITKTGILLEVDAADKLSYPGTGTTWINPVTPGTYNGTLNNISFDSNDSKGALTFTGSNTYVAFGNIGDLSSAWSFQVAFKPAATASGEPYTVLSYASGSDTGSITFKLDYSSSTQEVVLSTFSSTGSNQVNYAISGSALTGSWNIVHGTFGSSLAALFVNGLGVAYGPTTGSLTGYNASNQLYAGASYGSDTGFYTGSIANISVNNADLDGLSVNKNYNAFASRFGLPVRRPTITDADVFTFVETAGLTDETQILAINTLVLGLKSNNLWTKMQAIYPFVGGTAFSHKYNLKDPILHTISWNGAVDHSSNGVRFTSGGYGSLTGLSPLSFDQDSVSVSTYATENAGASGTYSYFGGGTSRLDPNFEVFNLGGNLYIQFNQPNTSGLNSGTFKNLGFVTFQRSNSTELNGYYNGSLVQSFSRTSTGRSSGTLAVGRTQNFFGTVTMADAYLGEALTDTEASNLYTLVLAYQTALGRNI